MNGFSSESRNFSLETASRKTIPSYFNFDILKKNFFFEKIRLDLRGGRVLYGCAAYIRGKAFVLLMRPIASRTNPSATHCCSQIGLRTLGIMRMRTVICLVSNQSSEEGTTDSSLGGLLPYHKCLCHRKRRRDAKGWL